MSRRLVGCAVLGLLVSGVAFLSAAQTETEEAKAIFRLTAEFDGISQIAPDAKVVSLAVREDEPAEIPITFQFDTEKGQRVRLRGSNLFVPSKLPVDTDDYSRNEVIPEGLNLSVRVQALPDGRALVDATFSTTAAENDMEAKTLLATTTSVRQVKPLGPGGSFIVRLPKEGGGGPTVVLKLAAEETGGK